MNLRKLNIFLVCGMLLAFLIHGAAGAARLMGGSSGAMKAVAWIGVAFVCAHIVVTTILTIQSLQVRKLSGTGYFRENKLFWLRRISGFAIIIPLVMHLMIFSGGGAGGAFRLQVFTTGRLISQILLILTLALHILTNIRPALIALGVKGTRSAALDVLLVLAVALLVFGVAFAVYYVRWMLI